MPLSTWYQISNSNSSFLETATNSLKLLSTSTSFDQLPSSLQTTTSQATTTTTTEEESTTKSAIEETTKSTKFTTEETTTLAEQLNQQEEDKNGGDISDISSLGKIDLSAIVLEDGLMDESLDGNGITFDVEEVDDTENEIDDDTFK